MSGWCGTVTMQPTCCSPAAVRSATITACGHDLSNKAQHRRQQMQSRFDLTSGLLSEHGQALFCPRPPAGRRAACRSHMSLPIPSEPIPSEPIPHESIPPEPIPCERLQGERLQSRLSVDDRRCSRPRPGLRTTTSGLLTWQTADLADGKHRFRQPRTAVSVMHDEAREPRRTPKLTAPGA